ncbi:CDGSH iron-sulfur domain-containing protein [Croceicoccus pelagius]|uniref:Iron-binding protein n=1 Tax=Croceicoccus pelagius TaxID=1703341 RepID=A0A916Y8D5_9SPHN|nr:CDGSH iron-sulfur domain-containing protein [Croceicoccus pelagius]GGD35156.1 iron-binding protein [Croceicoccus pelagius]
MADAHGIKITEDGPYEVSASLPLIDQKIETGPDGASLDWAKTGEHDAEPTYYLCRCGHSANKPFCDGSHEDTDFDGTETADRSGFVEKANKLEGPRYHLLDKEDLCAVARFCDTYQTVWKEVERTDEDEIADVFLNQIARCPSGRLVAVDAESGDMVEHPRDPRISTTQDPAEECSGPLYVEGGVSLTGADGERYESRNRMALCRCGASGNKPFCDGSHIKIGFSDRD